MSAPDCIVLVRHGETIGESSIRFHGRNDVPLSDVGRSQMRSVAMRLDGRVFDLVLTSPLARARESAEIAAPAVAPQVDPRLREIDFGEWEGLTAEEIEARDPELFREWQRRLADFDYPGGEVRSKFRERVAESAEAIASAPAESILVVVHKGVIRQICSHISGEILPEGEPELAGIVELSRSGRSWRVTRIGA